MATPQSKLLRGRNFSPTQRFSPRPLALLFAGNELNVFLNSPSPANDELTVRPRISRLTFFQLGVRVRFSAVPGLSED